MTEANSINASTTGIVGNTGTAFTGTAVTQYNVIVGGSTSSTLANVAPSATSGVPLISSGSSANPAFGTVVVAGGGTGATTLTGLLTGNGTSAITGTAITQYNVITGGASNAPNSVAPSATSGVPLISQGSSSQPVFGTAVVAGGGTGVTSATAYAVLCGGTTSTGPHQSIASVGTSGQVLTSNGAGALPTFQAAASTGGTLGTPTATTSGATVLVTGISASAKLIIINLDQVTPSATGIMSIQLGSGSLTTSGYHGASTSFGANTAWNTFALVTQFTTTLGNSGIITISLLNASTNVYSISVSTFTTTGTGCCGAGTVALSGAMDRFQLAWNGAQTFSAGQVNYLTYS